MQPFTRSETKIILIIFSILFLVVGYNMAVSIRRGRDNIRKNDMSAIQKPLDTFYQKYNVYPLATDNGEIIGCFSSSPKFDVKTGVISNAEICKWGESQFEDMSLLPRDPDYKKGVSYRYASNRESYTFYVALEGKDEAEYSKQTDDKYLQCGTRICNYERSN